MKYFVSLVALSIIGLMPKAMFACPSGWEYVYEQGVPSAGYDFSDQGTHYVGVGTMYDSNMFFRNLLVVDISAFAEPPYDTL